MYIISHLTVIGYRPTHWSYDKHLTTLYLSYEVPRL